MEVPQEYKEYKGQVMLILSIFPVYFPKGAKVKILDKVELIVRLKEKIEEAKKENLKSAKKLQNLLESIMKSGEIKAI